jgi:hypothetical protein
MIKKQSLLLLVIFIFTGLLQSKNVSSKDAERAAQSFIQYQKASTQIMSFTPVTNNKSICLYLANLYPAGYLILSSDDNLPPVIAYSFSDNIDTEGRLLEFAKKDITFRMNAFALLTNQQVQQNQKQWQSLILNEVQQKVTPQYWPPQGTTSTGGWLETKWNQNAPYNAMCPMDPVTSSRSYTGCPATAMAQILNYHQTTNNTHFTDADDYYHNYSGRTFYIDDDYAANGFPSFPQLNAYLDTLNMHYATQSSPTNNDKAALSFACGVAATQVYSSVGSGTFGVSQALDAYHRFGCNDAVLMLSSDSTLFDVLIQNMKDSLPAHLAIVDSAWSTGHNVVVDGYNTDNYFHLNFGWGGTSNGWYLLPSEIPYNLTVIEGLIVDILKPSSSAITKQVSKNNISIYPNPTSGKLTISTDVTNPITTVVIYNSLSESVFQIHDCFTKKEINLSGLNKGIYFIKASDGIKDSYTKFVIN